MRIHLRQLEAKDAPYMLEWMTDSTITCYFRFDAETVTLSSCKNYIEKANRQENCRHYAIADEKDEYLGTISLKEIDFSKKEAEYAISTRKKTHGTGVAMQATRLIWKIAFEELHLDRVYLNVLTENRRADAFYQKAGYEYERTEEYAVEIRGEKKALNWYVISRERYFKKKENG